MDLFLMISISGINSSILQHSGIWGAAVEAMLNKILRKPNLFAKAKFYTFITFVTGIY
jgi:hypothetical protein